MFFKRLELVGFKSFATKTIVEFLPGVTVIVGPNGCGKSNILDAIKWVLGNQSAKALRGSKMMDVIFSGSASFKPLGVAQVTLTLDNSRRTLDIDYDEVQITRRLFRTGESEYLLNKTVCRLRDIHDLFLGTGVGMSAYSILEQGKIDQIVNAKPEERRFLFEEAAGISKYKARRHEALRKLERTAEDLKRLMDLIGEVDRQVNSLKRQASKAESYKRATTELRQSEMELMVLRSSGLREQLQHLHQEIEQLQEQTGVLRSRYEEQSEAEQIDKDHSSEVETQLSQKSQENFDLTHRIKDLEHQSNRCNDRIRNHDQRLGDIRRELEDSKSREEDLTLRLNDTRERHSQACAERDDAARNFKEKEAEHADLREQVDEITRMIEQLGREVTRHREKLSHCENVIRIEETLIARNEETQRETATILERLETLLEEYGTRRNDLTRSLEQVTERIKAAEESASTLQIRYTETHSLVGELQRELDQTRRDLHQRQARLATLKELKANFEGFQSGVRDVMKAVLRSELKGVVGPVVNLLKSQREYEFALEVALGGHLQDVIVETTDSAIAAMNFITSGDHGRVTFLPLDRIGRNGLPGNLEAVLQKPGVIGHAPSLIHHDASLDPMVNHLLGNMALVQDFATAESLSREFPMISYVALDGRLILANGAMCGGNHKASGLLGREREIHELGEAVVQLGARQEEIQSRIQAQRELADEFARQIDSVKAALNEHKVERAGVSKEFESVNRVFKDSTQQLTQRQEQMDRLVREITEKKALKERTEVESIEHQRLLTETAERLDSAREQSHSQNETFMVLGGQLSDARAQVEKVRERIVHLEAGMQSLDRELKGLCNARESRESEQASLEKDSAQAREEIALFVEQLQVLTAKRAEIERELAEEKAEKDQLQARLRQLAHELEQIQRDERILENNLHERQVRQAELLGNFNNLAEQAREKFDRDLAELAEELKDLQKDPTVLAQEVAHLRLKIDRMGAVNLAALDEYNEQSTRLQFLTGQEKDLIESKTQIENSIAQLDEKTKTLFHETFESIRGHFIEMFRRLFNGGKADLVIDQSSGDPLLEGGVEIYAQPPGKKLQSLTLMSGGEKAMTAVSLLFALFLHKPAPFAILDEIDAPLDDANVERFKNVVMEFSTGTQFVIITHNKQTMALADAIYGVTMEESGVSKLVSVRFEQAVEQIAPSGSAG